jgi:ubiquitin carboxyl-terminal hydrolase 14
MTLASLGLTNGA